MSLTKNKDIFYYDKVDFQTIIDFISKRKPNEISYNSSIFHFLLYYCYKPKKGFVVKTKNSIIFCSYSGKNLKDLIISIPIFKSRKKAIIDLIDLFEKFEYKTIMLRDFDDGFINILRKDYDDLIKSSSLKEIYYATYDINKTLDLKGNNFSNLRWHLNSFEKANHKIECVNLKENEKEVIHLIGKWRSKTIKERGFSFIDVRSDKMAATFFSKNHFDSVLSNVLKIDGIISSFNLGFPLGFSDRTDIFAHAVGINDISIPHLAEYSQFEFWKQLKKSGYGFVNDGPTWRKSLGEFKKKFYPISMKRYYWLNILKN